MSRTRRALSVTVLTTVFVLTGCSVDAASASPGHVVTSGAQTTRPVGAAGAISA